MLKPGNNFLSPKSPSSSNAKGKKAASPRPKSNRGLNEGAKGNVPSKGKPTKASSSNLFSVILNDNGNEISQDLRNASKEGVSMEGVSTEANMGGTKKERHQLKNKFGHKMYENAALIYAYFRGEVKVSSIQPFNDEYQKRRAYSIAFAAKRYEEVLKDVLIDSHFYSMYSKFEAQHHNKIMVMLMDYYDHNFRFSDSKRITINDDTEEPQELIREIQEAIVSHHVHICASFARCRIRECALALEDLIKDDSKEIRRYAQQQPLYARVNTLKTTTNDVVNMLEREGFVLAENVELSELTGKMFRRDPHFDDMLVFSMECKDDVYSHNITMELWLYPQDKSKYIIVEVMKSQLVEMSMQKDKAMNLIPGEMKSFLTDGEDVLLTNPDSGSLSAHLASHINPDRKLFICGCPRDLQPSLEKKISASGVRNFELIEESFANLAHNDERLKKVRIILCNVACSKSGVVNPVDFILQEGNVAAKLLSGKVDVGKQRAIVSDENMTLKHSFTFNQVQSILYFTLSDKSAENEGLIMNALKEHREEPTVKNPFQLAPFLPDLISNIRTHVQDAEGGIENMSIGRDEKYLKLKPSSRMNGCFVALLKRQFLETAPKEVHERATKKGKGRSNKKLVTMKYSKQPADKKEEIVSEEKEPIREEGNPKEKLFHKFF